MSTLLQRAAARAARKAANKECSLTLSEVRKKAIKTSKDFREGKLVRYGGLLNRISVSGR